MAAHARRLGSFEEYLAARRRISSKQDFAKPNQESSLGCAASYFSSLVLIAEAERLLAASRMSNSNSFDTCPVRNLSSQCERISSAEILFSVPSVASAFCFSDSEPLSSAVTN